MLQILSLAIALSFVFLLFSLVVTAANELVQSAWDQRAKFLREGLGQLLGNDDATLRDFLDHGLVDAFSRQRGSFPSYLPSNTFVTALLDLTVPAKLNAAGQALRTAADVAEVLTDTGDHALSRTNPRLAESLRALFDEADGDVDRFRAGIERWFNQSGDRITGWYKRHVQQCLFLLALPLAIFANVDSLRIIQGLSADPRLLDSVVQNATDTVVQKPGDAGLPTTAEVNALANVVKDTLGQLNALPLPLGWGDDQWNYLFHDPGHGPGPRDQDGRGVNLAHCLSALAGWLLTALAASLGAPFWFQTLQRFITIRGNGRSPDEVDKRNVERVAAAVQAVAPAIAAATPAVDARRTTVIEQGGGR